MSNWRNRTAIASSCEQQLAPFCVYSPVAVLCYGKEGFAERMLQPLQLEEVSAQYAEEIADLRAFLAKAGLAVETSDALAGIVARLSRDRTFRRDLISHVWVIIDRYERQISYSGLLGVLAIAAAGIRFAAAANGEDAHDLLRFLMESRCALYTPSDKTGTSALPRDVEPASTRTSEPFPSPGHAGDQMRNMTAPPAHTDFPYRQTPQHTNPGPGRVVWGAAAACLLAALSIGLWLYHRPAANEGSIPPSIASAAGSSAALNLPPETDGTPSVFRNGELAAVKLGRIPVTRTGPRSMPSISVPAVHAHVTPFIPAPAAVRPSPATVAVTHAPVSKQIMAAVSPVMGTAHSVSATSSSLVPRAASIASSAPSVVPAAILSQRLGSPSVPTYALTQSDDSTPDTPKYPRLRRRRGPASASSSGDDSDRMAQVRPANLSAMPASRNMAAVNASRGGTVRPTSLGIMAANVLYTPVPAYPAAASSAHVQGEVRVQAQVDRDGNVAFARVISGPPLLRDAALDAVQRWHYRPYLSFGKPVSMHAMAVVEFELP